jgi:hypothetical protein
VTGLLEKAGLLDLLVVINLIVRRMFPLSNDGAVNWGLMVLGSGTVVLAVVGPEVELSKVVSTGLGNDRAANMLEFARLALEYLSEQLDSSTSTKI